MPRNLKALLALLLSFSLLLTTSRTAKGQTIHAAVTEVVVGLIAGGAALGIGIYYATRRPASLTGCTVSADNTLQLKNEGDHQTYTLIGDIADVKTGDRIRVYGKRKKKDPSSSVHFVVEKLGKDLGPCKVSPTAT